MSRNSASWTRELRIALGRKRSLPETWLGGFIFAEIKGSHYCRVMRLNESRSFTNSRNRDRTNVAFICFHDHSSVKSDLLLQTPMTTKFAGIGIGEPVHKVLIESATNAQPGRICRVRKWTDLLFIA